jgi:hypothetical protein
MSSDWTELKRPFEERGSVHNKHMEAATKLKTIIRILTLKTIIRILTLIAPLAGVNPKQIELVIAILNIITEEVVEATEDEKT